MMRLGSHNEQLSLPVHIDYTSIYGASLAIEPNQLESLYLPFSRLLAFSQLIEAVVLHDRLQFELGVTDDWGLYRDRLLKSNLMKLITSFDAPILPYEYQVDSDLSEVLSAAEWAAKQCFSIPLSPIEWAVRFRSGTYEALQPIQDAKNPMIEKHILAIRKNGNAILNQNVDQAILHLSANHVGILGFHILMRIYLLESHFVQGNRANYLPHFSRQPLCKIADDPTCELKFWTMRQISAQRVSDFDYIDKHIAQEDLSLHLSPIFLACLKNVTSPEGVFERAIEIRESPSARRFRQECQMCYAEYISIGESALIGIQTRIKNVLKGLNNELNPQRKRKESISEVSVQGSVLNLIRARKTIRHTESFLPRKDDAALFLNDILLDAKAIFSATEAIERIFRIKVQFDSNVLTWQSKSL
jgi:hypothetical protein